MDGVERNSGRIEIASAKADFRIPIQIGYQLSIPAQSKIVSIAEGSCIFATSSKRQHVPLVGLQLRGMKEPHISVHGEVPS